MKAIIYSAKKYEKEYLIQANAGKHELTWQTAPLGPSTIDYAAGHQAAVVFTNDEVCGSVIAGLAGMGIKYIITRSAGTDHIDFDSAEKHGIQVRNVPGYSPYAVAEHTVALSLALSRHLIEAGQNCKDYDFSLNRLTGFNLHGKTVGIIGMGNIGKVTGRIFHGFGCRVIACDTDQTASDPLITRVGLEELLQSSDIISLHIPLNKATTHLINSDTLKKMKEGAMLINTARGGLVSTHDVLDALDTGKLGYYGADVYEFERGLFFEDHEADQMRDALLSRLMDHANVLITPHQGFLTREALQDIACHTIKGLDEWQLEWSPAVADV